MRSLPHRADSGRVAILPIRDGLVELVRLIAPDRLQVRGPEWRLSADERRASSRGEVDWTLGRGALSRALS